MERVICCSCSKHYDDDAGSCTIIFGADDAAAAFSSSIIFLPNASTFVFVVSTLSNFICFLTASIVIWPTPTGARCHLTTLRPTPASECASRYLTSRSMTSGSASQALIARLCVRRSKFSWLFLCANGPRMTVHSERCVGSEAGWEMGTARAEAACVRKWV